MPTKDETLGLCFIIDLYEYQFLTLFYLCIPNLLRKEATSFWVTIDRLINTLSNQSHRLSYPLGILQAIDQHSLQINKLTQNLIFPYLLASQQEIDLGTQRGSNGFY